MRQSILITLLMFSPVAMASDMGGLLWLVSLPVGGIFFVIALFIAELSKSENAHGALIVLTALSAIVGVLMLLSFSFQESWIFHLVQFGLVFMMIIPFKLFKRSNKPYSSNDS